jgi:hypothetical protein
MGLRYKGTVRGPRWRIAGEGPGETGPVSITDGNAIPRSVIPFCSQNADYSRLVWRMDELGYGAQIDHPWGLSQSIGRADLAR